MSHKTCIKMIASAGFAAALVLGGSGAAVAGGHGHTSTDTTVTDTTVSETDITLDGNSLTGNSLT